MLTPRQVIEIFHLVFLRHLEEKLDKNLYALKGGCNLRFFFKSIRYSEDIDFDIRIVTKETLLNKINKLLSSIALINSLKSKGIEIAQITESKQTETTQRWKLSLKLSHSTQLLPTKIEFSRRKMTNNFLFEPIDNDLIHLYQLYPILTNHYPVEEAFFQKIMALAFRKETQARDIFDLKLLWDRGVILKKFEPNIQDNIEMAIENMSAIGFPEFKGQVVAFLMSEYQNYYNNIEVWNKLKNEVLNILKGLKNDTH